MFWIKIIRIKIINIIFLFIYNILFSIITFIKLLNNLILLIKVLLIFLLFLSNYIITFNKKDYTGVEKFGIQVLTPREYLERIGEI